LQLDALPTQFGSSVRESLHRNWNAASHVTETNSTPRWKLKSYNWQ
jgi:hypothetical protein